MLKGHFRPPPSSPRPVRAMRMYAGAKGSMGGRHTGSRCQNYCCQYPHDLCGKMYIFILGPTSHFFSFRNIRKYRNFIFQEQNRTKNKSPFHPLLAAHANVHLVDKNARSALHYAAEHAIRGRSKISHLFFPPRNPVWLVELPMCSKILDTPEIIMAIKNQLELNLFSVAANVMDLVGTRSRFYLYRKTSAHQQIDFEQATSPGV